MTDTKACIGTNKICKICKRPPSKIVIFGKHKYRTKNGFSYVEKSTCKKCEAELAKQYRQNHPEAVTKSKNKYRSLNSGTIRYHVQEKISTWKKASNIASDLTVEYLVELYSQQNGCCYYSNEKMVFGWIDGKVQHNTLSLDKLDPTKGYVKENVVWCSYLANTMKQDMNEQQFYNYMLKILENNGKEKTI